MREAALVLLVGIAGCGRYGFDDCGWSTPARVAELSSAQDDYTGLLAPDGLSLYLASAVTGNLEIYVATRQEIDLAFGAPIQLDVLGSTANDSRASVTGDQLELYFTSDRDGALGLYLSRRSSATDPWGSPARLAALCPQGCTGPNVTSDGLRLYYNTTVVDGQWGTLMVSTRADRTAEFESGTPTAGLDDSNSRGFAVLTADERTIMFEQYDRGTGTTLYQATRRSRDSSFTTARPVPGLDDGSLDSDPTLRGDGLELYFASAPDGQSDLFVTTRPCR